jgi:hypothetical protein
MSPRVPSLLRNHEVILNQHRERFFHRNSLSFYGSFQEPPCDDPLKSVLCFWVVNQVLQYFMSSLYFFVSHMVKVTFMQAQLIVGPPASAAPAAISNLSIHTAKL